MQRSCQNDNIVNIKENIKECKNEDLAQLPAWKKAKCEFGY